MKDKKNHGIYTEKSDFEGLITKSDSDYITVLSEKFYTNRDSLVDLISMTTHRKKMVEIGSLAGFSTRLFARYFELVVSIDPYEPGYDEQDINSQTQRLLLAKDLFHLRFVDDPGVIQLQEKSVEAATRFEDQSLDLVYIDAGHNFEAVKNDIETWLPKVRIGGFIAGDDYTWPGLKDAVSALLPEHQVIDGRWITRVSGS